MKKALPGMTIYQVFVRNHTEEGTFLALIEDLPRIRALNVDILYLLPIHEIGNKARKGKYGSPYSIKDYRSISPDLGTLEDFIGLVKAAHEHGLKIMMDMVFHHTSRDAIYIEQHPDWYIYKNGKLANKVGDWSDICDFEINNPALQDYLIDTLVYWTRLGVDGFRFDVASMIPISFWLKARKAVESVNPQTIWLAESIELGFIDYLRSINEVAEDDATLYQAFDILYDYDIFTEFKNALEDPRHIETYIEALNRQRTRHGQHLKLHFLENHDQERIASRLGKNRHLNWIKFIYLIYGVNFLYGGEEFGLKHKPDLFEKDPLDVRVIDQDIHAAYQRAIVMKKDMHSQGINVTNIAYMQSGQVRLTFNQPYQGQSSLLIDLA